MNHSFGLRGFPKNDKISKKRQSQLNKSQNRVYTIDVKLFNTKIFNVNHLKSAKSSVKFVRNLKYLRKITEQ